jgi:ADP-heptose:LPS heptosyltransferase
VTVLGGLPHGARAAVVRLRSLGDCVLTTPALHILKSARPDIRVAVVVEERFREIFEPNPDVDALLSPSVRELRAFEPDLCLNLHGGARSARLTALSGARCRAGFAHFPSQFLYQVRIPRAQQILEVDRKVHTAEHLASAMFYLGAPRTEIPRAKLLLSRPLSAPSRRIVIHPFASAPEKTWPAANFLRIAQELGRAAVFIGGAGDDFAPFRGFETLAGASLGEVKALLAGASLFVGNDSGPAHMAAAFGVPSVVLFSASDPIVWAPWKTPAETIVVDDIRSLAAGRVIAAVERLRVAA